MISGRSPDDSSLVEQPPLEDAVDGGGGEHKREVWKAECTAEEGCSFNSPQAGGRGARTPDLWVHSCRPWNSTPVTSGSCLTVSCVLAAALLGSPEGIRLRGPEGSVEEWPVSVQWRIRFLSEGEEGGFDSEKLSSCLSPCCTRLVPPELD